MPSDRVRRFYGVECFAVFGVSRTRRNMSRSIYDSLAALGKRVYAIGPQVGNIEGIEFYDSFKGLPERPQAIIVGTKPENAITLMDEIAASGVEHVWFQQGSYDGHVMALANRLGINPIKGCIMMYMPGGAFFHGIHRVFAELLGGGYK